MHTKHIFVTLVQLVVPLIAFLLGMISSRMNFNRYRIKEQFDSFHAPYLGMYIRNQLWLYPIWSHSGHWKMYSQFLSDKFHYASPEVQGYILDMFRMDRIIINKMANMPTETVDLEKKELGKIIITITDTIFEEYISLCKRLKLSEPNMPPYTKVSDL